MGGVVVVFTTCLGGGGGEETPYGLCLFTIALPLRSYPNEPLHHNPHVKPKTKPRKTTLSVPSPRSESLVGNLAVSYATLSFFPSVCLAVWQCLACLAYLSGISVCLLSVYSSFHNADTGDGHGDGHGRVVGLIERGDWRRKIYIDR